jgi:hypothetical protein
MHFRFLPLLLFAVPAGAQDFDFVIDSTVSTSVMITDVQIVLPGSGIGTYDATTNPGGTRTINGAGGGSGNEDVPMNITIDNDSGFTGIISGTFSLSMDLNTMAMSIDDMELDLLTGSLGSTNIDLIMLYNDFTTRNPDSFFVGGAPVTVPLGSFPIVGATVTQFAPSQGGALGPPKGSDFSFWVGVPVGVAFVVDFNGTLAPLGPFNVTMSLPGTLTYTATGMYATAGLIGGSTGSVNDPFPGFTINDANLFLPTIQPPGMIANLLFDSVIASMTHDVTVDFVVEADGIPSGGPCNVVFCDTDANNVGDVSLSTCDCSGGAITLDLSMSFPGQFTYPLVGLGTTAVSPTGVSELCIAGSTIGRYNKDAGAISASGTYSIDLLNTASAPGGGVPTIGGSLCNGNTWRFQYWHRDGMNPSRFSKGISGMIN